MGRGRDQHLILDPPENNGSRYAYTLTLIQLADESFLLAYNVNATYTEVLAVPSIYRLRFRSVRVMTPCSGKYARSPASNRGI